MNKLSMALRTIVKSKPRSLFLGTLSLCIPVTLAFTLTSCAFLFSHSSTSEVVSLPVLDNQNSPFVKIDGQYPVYKSTDNHYLTAIQECDIASGKRHSTLARARELFVGFSFVRVPQYSQKTLGDRAVERALILATLDDTPVSVASYVIPGKPGCVYDLIMWQHQGDDEDYIAAIEKSEQELRPWLGEVVKSLVE